MIRLHPFSFAYVYAFIRVSITQSNYLYPELRTIMPLKERHIDSSHLCIILFSYSAAWVQFLI